MREETGIVADPGPERFRREVEFLTIEGVEVTADERFFVVPVDASEIDTAGHTELERRVMTSWRWFDQAAIAAHHEAIYPEDLLAMLEQVNEDAACPKTI